MTWVKINQNENYSINENGEVRNNASGKIKKQYVCKGNGYLYVDLWKDNKGKKIPVHRLLATAFIPNPQNKPTVDHIDGNRTNNDLNNLRWATYSEQNSRFESRGVRSEKVVVKRYKEERKKRGGGHVAWLEVIEELNFKSIKEASEYFDTTISNISLMLEKGTIGQRGAMRGYQFIYKKGERAKVHKRVTTIETEQEQSCLTE